MKSTAVLIVVPALKEYDFVEKAAMCVYWKDRTAVCSTKTGRFSAGAVWEWKEDCVRTGKEYR